VLSRDKGYVYVRSSVSICQVDVVFKSIILVGQVFYELLTVLLEYIDLHSHFLQVFYRNTNTCRRTYKNLKYLFKA